MKRWKLSVLACLVVVSLSAMLVGCQSGTYSPEANKQAVSDSVLVKSGTLRVGVNASSAPLAGQTSSSSRIVGIDVDVAAYLADQLGLKVEIVDVSNDPSTALEEKTVDVVLGVDASTENEADYWRSSSYLQTGVALFGSSSETSIPTADSAPQIAAQASSKSSWRVTNLFGDASLVTENDLKSAFDAVEGGAARYCAADAVIGTYVANTNGYSSKIVALLQDPSGYCAAVAAKNTDLQSAIGSAITSMVKGGVMDIIENKWLGTPLNLSNMTVVKAATAEAAPAAPAEGEAAPAEGEAAPAEGEAAPAEVEAAPAEGEEVPVEG